MITKDRSGHFLNNKQTSDLMPHRKKNICIHIVFLAMMGILMGPSVCAEQVVDALGRTVGGESTPQRIVSLVPAMTEILFALEVEDQIVGVTSYCNYPDPAKSKPKIGEYANPNLEILATLNPDLVFMAADASSPELLSRLEGLGISVYIVYPRSVSDTAGLIRSLGRLLDKQPKAEALAATLDETAECVRNLTSDRPRVSVLCTVMSKPLVVAGGNTLLDDMVGIAGGDNVVPEGINRYPTWGIESVLAADPDVILVSPHPGQVDPSAFYRQWPELKAVKNNRLVTIDADWIQRPGPRLVAGLKALAKALHGVSPELVDGRCLN
jgi:iron complex transport system substrate-binding protein